MGSKMHYSTTTTKKWRKKRRVKDIADNGQCYVKRKSIAVYILVNLPLHGQCYTQQWLDLIY